MLCPSPLYAQESLPADTITTLPDATKKTIEDVSRAIHTDTPPETQGGPIVIERGKYKPSFPEKEDDESGEENPFRLSLSEEKKQSSTSEATENLMIRAYNAYMAGHLEVSAMLYKQVLTKDGNNKEASFGLATAYYKLRQFNQSREIYADMLAKRPDDPSTLNNFVVLLREETPEAALDELKKLEQINGNISAIPAQIGMTYAQLDNLEEATRYLRRAAALDPENISYRYNLAILLDRQKKYTEAAAIYRRLLMSVSQGKTIPGNVDMIQQRLRFISQRLNEG